VLVDDQPQVAATGHLHTPFPSPASWRPATARTSRPNATSHRTAARRTAPPRWTDRDTPRILVVAAGWSWRLLLVGVVAYLVVRLLALLWLVVVPVLAALLLSALIQPVTTLLRRYLSGPAAAAVTLLLSVVLLAGLGYGVGLRFVHQLPTLSDEMVATIGRLRTQLRGSGVGQAQLDQLQDVATGWLQEHRTELLDYLTTGAGYVLEFLTVLVLTLFVAFFLLYDGARVWRWLLGPLPRASQARVDRAGRAAWATLTAYVHGTAVIATFHGVVIGLVLFLLHVPLVLPLAVLVFLGGFVPLAGALAAGGLAVLVALGTRGWATALILLGVLLVENQVEAHLLQPLVMGRYVRLHPLAIGLAIAVGSVLGGIPGAIVAVPLAAIFHRAAPLLTARRRGSDTNARPRPRSRRGAAGR
jgi:predicted PurR-regulated permease PerM